MSKKSSPIRKAGTVAVRALPTLGAGTAFGGGALAGHPVAGAVVAVAAVAGQLVGSAIADPKGAASLVALFCKDTDAAVKRIEALTALIDKLR
jgi:hypothetical protein